MTTMANLIDSTDPNFMTFDGSNGGDIAAQMTLVLNERRPREMGRVEVFVNQEISPSLSLSQTFAARTPGDEVQTAVDRYRVPVGYTINVRSGEVFNADGEIQDYADLIQM